MLGTLRACANDTRKANGAIGWPFVVDRSLDRKAQVGPENTSIELREERAQTDAEGLVPLKVRPAGERVAGVEEADRRELARQDLHGPRAKLDVVRDEIPAEKEVRRIAAQSIAAAQVGREVQVVAPPVEQRPVDDDAPEPGDRGRDEVRVRLHHRLGDPIEGGLGEGGDPGAKEAVADRPRVLRRGAHADQIERGAERAEARGQLEHDVLAESVVLLESERVEVDHAQVALRVRLVLNRRTDPRVAHRDRLGDEVGDGSRIGAGENGAVDGLVDAHGEGEVVLGVPPERAPQLEEGRVLVRAILEGNALARLRVVERVEARVDVAPRHHVFPRGRGIPGPLGERRVERLPGHERPERPLQRAAVAVDMTSALVTTAMRDVPMRGIVYPRPSVYAEGSRRNVALTVWWRPKRFRSSG